MYHAHERPLGAEAHTESCLARSRVELQLAWELGNVKSRSGVGSYEDAQCIEPTEVYFWTSSFSLCPTSDEVWPIS